MSVVRISHGVSLEHGCRYFPKAADPLAGHIGRAAHHDIRMDLKRGNRHRSSVGDCKLGAAIAGNLVPEFLSGGRFRVCAAMDGESLLARACEPADAVQLLPDSVGSGLRFSGFPRHSGLLDIDRHRLDRRRGPICIWTQQAGGKVRFVVAGEGSLIVPFGRESFAELICCARKSPRHSCSRGFKTASPFFPARF